MIQFRRLLVGESGQAAVEYGLIAAALIACLAVAGGGIVQIQKSVYENQHKGLQDWRAP
jgi:Flp pilus assembly pilin Flp